MCCRVKYIFISVYISVFLDIVLGNVPRQAASLPWPDITNTLLLTPPTQSADSISADKINCPSIFLPSRALCLHGKGRWINQTAVPPDTQNTDPPASLSLVPTSASPVIRIHSLKFIPLPPPKAMIVMMQNTQTTLSVTRKLITFRCTGGDIHKRDRAGEESVVQLPQASDKGFLLIKAASRPLVNLIEVQIKIQACLDVEG